MATVSYTRDVNVARITISRPERRNALDHSAVVELHEAVERSVADEVRCVVVTGDGGHFCAGADLKELEDLAFTDVLRAALDGLASLSCPSIAAIAGSCMGLGMQIALACDLRLATPEARFAVPVAKLGLMVDHWTVRRLAMQAGHSTARWLMLTAESIDARRASEVGLVQRLVEREGGVAEEGVDGQDPGGAVLSAADLLARDIADLAPLALAGSKLGLDMLECSDGDAEQRYRAAFEAAWASDDLVEGRRAFSERRPPRFRGS